MIGASTGSGRNGIPQIPYTPYGSQSRGCLSGRHGAGTPGGTRGRLAGTTGPARRRAAVPGFFQGVRGAVALETALAVSVLVVALAGIMQIVNTVFMDDRAGSAARAAARALALDPDADPWAAVWKELDPDAAHACTTDWTAANLGACKGWTLAVVHGASPAALVAALEPGATAPAGTGDLILVGLSRPPASIPGVSPANAIPSPAASRTAEDLVKMDAIGVARREPDA